MTWNSHRPTEENLNLLAATKSRNDLFDYALSAYEFTPNQAYGILVEANLAGKMKKFDNKNWWLYLDALRLKWLEKREVCLESAKPKPDRDELIRLTEQLRVVVSKSSWYWYGPQEALDAKWKLDDMDRKEKMSKWRNRYYGNYIRDLE